MTAPEVERGAIQGILLVVAHGVLFVYYMCGEHVRQFRRSIMVHADLGWRI
jgi:hypothetical protein